MTEVIITGDTGYLGSHFLNAANFTNRLRLINLSNHDLRKPLHISHPFTGKSIYHFAANKDAAESVINPTKYLVDNNLMLFNALKLAPFSSMNYFHFISSAAVYSENLNPYGLSKVLGEKIVMSHQKTSANIFPFIHRVFNPAGHVKGCTKDESASFFSTLEKCIKNNETFHLYGDPWRDFFFVGDIFKKISEGRNRMVNNIKSGNLYNLEEILKITGVNYVKHPNLRDGDVQFPGMSSTSNKIHPLDDDTIPKILDSLEIKYNK